MATAAETRPATLPLPGGQEGATVSVRPLLSGTAAGPEPWFHREEGRLAKLHALGLGIPRPRMIRIPLPAFLVEHPGAGPMLVDTGLHPSVAVDPKENLGRLFLMAFNDLEFKPTDAVPSQLRALGIEPSSVGTIVMTHLHGDHASAMSEFPGATFVFSEREWRAAVEQGPLHGYVKRHFDHAFDYRTIDFESEAVGSFSTFARSVDLFGDGSVRLLYTPGHTHGHLSLLLRLRERDVLVAGDAIYSMRTLEDDHLPARMEDEHRFRRSLKELQLFVREQPDTVVIPGHDLDAWERLERAYE